MTKIKEQIIDLWVSSQARYREMSHAEVRTCADAKAERGDAIGIGTKSILLKSPADFFILAINSEQRIDFKRLRKVLSIHKCRFASPDEMLALTGLRPGSMPPFGKPIFNLPLYADQSIFRHPTMAFSPGSFSHSIFVQTTDYIEIARPIRIDLSESGPPKNRRSEDM